jgi:glycerol-3-phosphate dehydrogenase
MSRYAASRLGPQRRAADLLRLARETFDVLIIGGGVTGTGAAVDAAARGLSVALVEAHDLAAGTSSRSTKLVHGGLRYLEQAEFPLVHEALTERNLLANRLAPHLVRPVPILLPMPPGPLPVRAVRRLYYGTGLALYDGFAAGRRGMPVHRHLSRTAARRLFPSLRPDVAAGAIRFYDGQVDDARLVVTLARTAASLGAVVLTGVEAVQLRRRSREVTGAWVRDRETGDLVEVFARSVVAATGVWSDDISALLPDARPGLRVRASKGVHIVVPRAAITGDAGLILRTPGSVLFVLPWGGHWIIGTTDTDWWQDRFRPVASAHDVGYLLAQVNQVLDRPIAATDIEGVYAGLRPLLAGEDAATSALSRKHAVVEPMLGLFLVAGGKLTTYRVMAADVIDRVVRRLGGGYPRSRTDQLPLLGADGYAAAWRDRVLLADRFRVPAGVVEHLLERYGSLAGEVLAVARSAPGLAEPVAGAPEYLAAEILYGARAEGALHLEDVLARRTRIAIETPHRGEQSARHAVSILASELGWSPSDVDHEVADYLRSVEIERECERLPEPELADVKP